MSQTQSTNSTRRRFLAGAAVAAIVPTAAVAASADAALVDAAAAVPELDKALEAFLDANNDDDRHPEFQAMDRQRYAHLDTLATVPAVSAAGVWRRLAPCSSKPSQPISTGTTTSACRLWRI
ncbi:hypothetical protein [Bradyrhizobium viridifuturi]|uniref:hypothetical protein n=1 Tax=Bradyrhizobium viridifuturi TaxID=1654716 RepID=UPI00067EADDB|nr:hypothetical protein [Bradyrhizobium viridifuturi]